jgi:beta-fructofuranosidase
LTSGGVISSKGLADGHVARQDNPVTRIPYLALLAIVLWSSIARGQNTNQAVAQATAAMAAATPRAQSDPAHPAFHVTSPAQWMNDPNGPIFYKGYYHLFYQLTPFSDESGIKYWGHVRSRDLVKWEPLPIALWPSTELGEESIWSGCCTVNGDGKPMAFYTSIGQGKSAFDQAVQWAATSDDNLITWQKSPANPVLPEAVNGATKIYDWRDPFVFHDGNKTFLVAGGHMAKTGDAAVNLYEAQNAGLTKWVYRGVLFHVPDAPTAECPNFFKLGDQWVLFVSPYGKVQYFVGAFDEATYRFHPHSHGFLDYGSSFYAPNTMQVPDGRRLVWGWLNGFPSGHGWNGCLSLPRLLSLSRDGQLQQEPAPQLTKLRGEPLKWLDVQLENSDLTLVLPKTNTLEILADIDVLTAKNVELQIESAADEVSPIVVSYNGTELQVLDNKAPLLLKAGESKLSLRIFVDRSVLEVFANGTVCITQTISPFNFEPDLKIGAHGGSATVKRLQAWPIRTIW